MARRARRHGAHAPGGTRGGRDHVEIRGTPVTDVTWSRQGQLRWTACWPDAVRVVYTHGYKTVPEDIADAVLTEARYLLTVQPGISAMTVGGESLSFSSPTGTMPESWTRAVDRYRLNRGTSRDLRTPSPSSGR